MTTNNNNTIVWGCIGRSCALCKKDHKACNGARPCTRCIGMGWESECRDVALKPRGRPRKTRATNIPSSKSATSKGAKKGSKARKEDEDESDCEEEQELSISPSLFVSSFPFRPVKDSAPVVSMDISEKVNRLTQRLVTQLPPSGLRSDSASPKVNRKRRASGPSAVEASKRREMNKRAIDNDGSDGSDDESDDDSEDEDEINAAMEEDLTPFESVFRVNLVSSCSSSSKKSDRKKKGRVGTVKTTATTIVATTTTTTKKEKDNNDNIDCNNNSNNCLRKSAERLALQKLEEEIQMFNLELPTLDNTMQQQPQQPQQESVDNGLLPMNTDSLFLCTAEPDIPLATNISCAEQYVQQYWSQKQQQQQQIQQIQQQQALEGENMLDAFMSDVSSSTSSFMFLKTEPMALAQEERLGRNPYFIRTPPQMRRNAFNAKAACIDDCMEDEGSW